MKKIIFFILFGSILLKEAIHAQTPQKFSYQAIVRTSDVKAEIVQNREVSLKFSILSDCNNCDPIYQELVKTKTNQFGLFTHEIGGGTVEKGNFSKINWTTLKHFLKVELDLLDGKGFLPMGTTQLLSVPYAFAATKVVEKPMLEELSNLKITDPQTEESLVFQNGLWVNKALPKADNWGAQVVVANSTLSGNGTSSSPLQLANGAVTSSKIANNAITSEKLAPGLIPSLLNDLFDVEITLPQVGQVLKWNGTNWIPGEDKNLSISGGNGIFVNGNIISISSEVDANQFDDITNTSTAGGDVSGIFSNLQVRTGVIGSNEIANGSIRSEDLGPNVINSSNIIDGTIKVTDLEPGVAIQKLGELQDVSTTGIEANQILVWDGSKWVPKTVKDSETQVLSLDGSKLSISKGNSITLPADNDGQKLSLSGDQLSISNGNSITLPAQRLIVNGNQLSISNGNTIELPTNSNTPPVLPLATTDQTLRYNGTLARWDSTSNLLNTGSQVLIGKKVLRPLGEALLPLSFALHVAGDFGVTGSKARIFSPLGGTMIIESPGSQPRRVEFATGAANYKNWRLEAGKEDRITLEHSSDKAFSNSTAAFEFLDDNSFLINGINTRNNVKPAPTLLFASAATDRSWYLTGDATFGKDSRGTMLIGYSNTSILEVTPNSINPFRDRAYDCGLMDRRWRVMYTFSSSTFNSPVSLSDIRLQKDVQDLEEDLGLETLLNMRPISFKWKDENIDTKTHIGFIAQELEKVIPAMVYLDSDFNQSNEVRSDLEKNSDKPTPNYMSISYSELIPVTVKAIKEQQTQIESLKKENNQLRTELDSLKIQLQHLVELVKK